MHSIILTVHNKDWLLEKVLEGIYYNTRTPYELIIVLDGCSDNSERVVWDTLLSTPVEWKLLHAPDVYETKANNLGLKAASGDKVIIIQDDIIVNEKDWNVRMEKPFKAFDDVFAVTGNTAHNWVFNPNSVHLGMEDNLDNCWCDILDHVDHASRTHILPRDIFAARCTANRGPLMIDHSDLQKLNYLMKNFHHKIWMIMIYVIEHIKNLVKLQVLTGLIIKVTVLGEELGYQVILHLGY